MLCLNVHKYREDISELYYSPSGPQIFFTSFETRHSFA